MYDEIDEILTPWAKKHGLHFFTKHQDFDVRMTYVVDNVGNTYQVSISPIDEPSGKILVHYGIYSKIRVNRKSETCISSIEKLGSDLESIFSQIEDWIAESGNSRTQVL